MKPKLKKSGKIPLSDKIADALTIKPRADIEDDHIFNTKPYTVSRADFSSDSEDEALISDFRKQSVNLLSEISKKYEGKIVSRKEQHEVSSEEGSEDSKHSLGKDPASDSDNIDSASDVNDNGSATESDESDDYSITKTHGKININSADDQDEESCDSDNEEDDESDEGDEGNGYDISQMEEPMKEEFEHVKKQNLSEEAKKGICVRNQLLLWEGLLEMRIHMQRCVNTANMMPTTDVFSQLKESKDFVDENSIVINNVASVIDKFINLQKLLLNKYPETNTLIGTKGKDTKQNAMNESDEEIPSDTDNEEIPSDTDAEDEPKHKEIKTTVTSNKTKKRKLDDYEGDIATLHGNIKKFRDTTIQKWNEKTRIATAANIKIAPTNTILQQISFILSDRNKLVRRTQLKRSDYEIIGCKKEHVNEDVDKQEETVNPTIKDRKDNDEYIPEIFDDSDFYHQLLRELIECKSADISDPVQLSRQWIALQQMRSKMKRKVDTKATKGRRIKYVVHNKLVNYLAAEKCSKWSEESTNELYSSLFGKMFEHNNVGLNVNLDNISLK